MLRSYRDMENTRASSRANARDLVFSATHEERFLGEVYPEYSEGPRNDNCDIVAILFWHLGHLAARPLDSKNI
jgi:hypothetical protein